MSDGMASLLDQARTSPAVLREVVRNPEVIALRFGLDDKESRALAVDNFDVFSEELGVGRIARAAHHDDAYLS